MDGEPDLDDKAIIVKVVEKGVYVEYYVNWLEGHGQSDADDHSRLAEELHLISAAP